MDAPRPPATSRAQGAAQANDGRDGHQPSISLVLPAFNNAATIRQAIAEAAEALGNLTSDYEIIVVDDGSTDGTGDIARAEVPQIPSLSVISHGKHLGYGAALRSGLRAATKSLVGYTDADCQFDLAQLDRLVLLTRDHDVACGYRLGSQVPWQRRWIDRTYSLVARLLLGTQVRDCTCPLKLIRKDVLRKLSLESDGPFIHAELLAQVRLHEQSIVEVGVTHRSPAGNAGKISLLGMLLSLMAMVRFYWSVMKFPQRESSGIEQDNAAQPWPFSRTVLVLILLALIASPVLLFNLSYPLMEPDENRNAQISMEMFRSGDYVVPTRNGLPYISKPPLLFWMVSASYGLFGICEWAARLPVALAALLAVLVTFLLGRNLVGNRAAWIGALLLLLSGGFVLAGRYLLMDAVLTLCVTTGLLAAYAGGANRRHRTLWWLLAGVACGVGILVKGPVALVLVLPPLVACQWLSRGAFSMRWREGALLIGVALLLSAPWYLLVEGRQGEFVGEFFWKQNVMRYTNAFDHQEPWWFYPPVIVLGMLPVSALFPALAAFLVSRRSDLRVHRTQALGFLVLAAGWVVLFFSMSSSKLPTYILPAIPAICLLLGRLLDAVLLPAMRVPQLSLSPYLMSVASGFPRHVAIACGAVGIAAVIGDIIMGADSIAGLAICGIILLGSLAMLAVVLRRGWPATSGNWIAIAAAAVVLMTYGFNDLFPEGAALRSNLRALAREMPALRKHSSQARAPLVFYGTLGESACLYMDDRGTQTFTNDRRHDLYVFAHQRRKILVVTGLRTAQRMQSELPPTLAMKPVPGTSYAWELSVQDQVEEWLASRPKAETR